MARHRARELVMHGLYERQLSGRADDDIASALLAEPTDAPSEDADAPSGNADGVASETTPVDRAYLAELWRGVTTEYAGLLAALAPAVDRRIEALAPIERALLVIGAWELAHRRDVPYRVVIDEAVELAKAYGGTDGHKFVNAVLDKVAPRLRGAEPRAPGSP